MAKSIRLAILLLAILCLVPGCDDETDPNGACDVEGIYDAYRCRGNVIQECRDSDGEVAYGDDPPGTWQDAMDCDEFLEDRTCGTYPFETGGADHLAEYEGDLVVACLEVEPDATEP